MIQRNNNIKKLTQLSILLAIQIILTFTNFGFIMVPPVAITILHIPVIIGSLILGYFYGGLLGLAFGILSMIKASMGSVSPIDMLFSPIASGEPINSIIMSVLPRVILGILPALLFTGFKKIIKKDEINIGLSAAISTAVHTVLVLGFLWLFFKGIPFKTIFLAVSSLNGTLEIVSAVILSIAVCSPLKKYLEKNK